MEFKKRHLFYVVFVGKASLYVIEKKEHFVEIYYMFTDSQYITAIEKTFRITVDVFEYVVSLQ